MLTKLDFCCGSTRLEGDTSAPLSKEADRFAQHLLTGYRAVWRKYYTYDMIGYRAPMDDQELVKKLEELENKQWANRALAEIRGQTKAYEYQIIFKTEEEGFFSAIKEFSSAGYAILPGTTLFQSEVFIVLMRRDKVK